MKRSFYEMLGVEPNATQAQIDTAYALATARINAASLPGVKEDVNEMYLIREGYQILSDPAKREIYDAKLADFEFALYPKDRESQHKLGVHTVILAVLTAIFGAIIYAKLNQKIDVKIEEVRIETKQAITKQKGN
jgi:DnaJ-class molecular chaperone